MKWFCVSKTGCATWQSFFYGNGSWFTINIKENYIWKYKVDLTEELLISELENLNAIITNTFLCLEKFFYNPNKCY